MAERKESSVMFSLGELMQLEAERVVEEEHNRRLRAEEERAARQAEAQRLLDAQQERLSAEEARRHQEELRRREEAVRLEAIRLGELERVRTETALRLQMERIEKERAEERQLAAANAERRAQTRGRVLVGFAGVACVAAAGAFVAWIDAAMTPAPSAEQQLLESARATNERQAKLLEQMKEQNDLSQRKLENERNKTLEAADAGRAPAAPSVRPGRQGPPTVPASARPQPKCDPNNRDPLLGFCNP